MSTPVCSYVSVLEPILSVVLSFISSDITERVDFAVTLKTCNREMHGSDPGRDSNNPDRGISLFSAIPPGKCRDNIYYLTVCSLVADRVGK
jgi:hypothetical protein